jgi:hypothetical protein
MIECPATAHTTGVYILFLLIVTTKGHTTQGRSSATPVIRNSRGLVTQGTRVTSDRGQVGLEAPSLSRCCACALVLNRSTKGLLRWQQTKDPNGALRRHAGCAWTRQVAVTAPEGLGAQRAVVIGRGSARRPWDLVVAAGEGVVTNN